MKKDYSEKKKESYCDKNQIVEELLPYIKSTALRLSWRLPPQLAIEDLIHEGIIGLLESIERYDNEKGDILTFAKHRIKGAMLDEINKFRSQTKSQKQKFHAIMNACTQLEKELGRPPEADEIAQRLELTIDEYYDLLMNANFFNMLNFDEILDNQNGSDNLKKVIAEKSAISPLERFEELEKKRLLEEIIDELPEREKLILSLYYWDELSMKEISQVLDMSEGRVCQIHKKILIWLRAKLESDKRIKDFLNFSDYKKSKRS